MNFLGSQHPTRTTIKWTPDFEVEVAGVIDRRIQVLFATLVIASIFPALVEAQSCNLANASGSYVNGGEIPGQRGGVKAGQWREAKIVPQQPNGW